MKKLKIIGISILVAGAVSFIWSVVDYLDYLKTAEYIKTACDNPATNCPILDTSSLLYYEILGIILIFAGSIVLTLSRKRSKIFDSNS